MSKPYLVFLAILMMSLYGASHTACQSITNSQHIAPDGLLVDSAKVQTVAFINVNVLPMDKEAILKNQTVVVRNGEIALIGAADQIEVPDNAVKIEGRGQYLMPGLADMHVHIRDETELISYLSYGVTTVLNMRGSPEILELRTKIENNEIIAPAIFTASPLLDGDPPIWSGSGTIVVTDPEDARRVVINQKRAGYDFIKIYNRLSPDVYRSVL